MTTQKLSVQEIKAVAEAAITTAQKVVEAKAAAENAGGTDEVLNKALTDAEAAATTAKAAADALSQDPTLDQGKKVQKLKRKKAIITRELEKLGEDDNEDDDLGDEDDEDDDLDDDQPLTRGDLKRMQANAARKTAVEMVDAIEDEGQRAAVKDALKRVVASGVPEKDFADAVAIASRERNDKILEELGRKVVVPRRTGTRTGAAPKVEEAFTPTAEEQAYMRPPFNLGKKEILEARAKAKS